MMKLIHGDCRDYIDDVVKGEGNPVIVSDPPFNINYKYRTYKDNLIELERVLDRHNGLL